MVKLNVKVLGLLILIVAIITSGCGNTTTPTNTGIPITSTAPTTPTAIVTTSTMSTTSTSITTTSTSTTVPTTTTTIEKPEETFGFSEVQRKEIFLEIVEAEDRAMIDAEKVFPTPDPLSPNYSPSVAMDMVYKQIELEELLQEANKDELAKKYNLTQEQLKEIGIEGLKKGWLSPTTTLTSTISLPPQCASITAAEVYSDSEVVSITFKNNCGVDILITTLSWTVYGANINTGKKLEKWDSLAEDVLIKPDESKRLNFDIYTDNIYDVYNSVKITRAQYRAAQ